MRIYKILLTIVIFCLIVSIAEDEDTTLILTPKKSNLNLEAQLNQINNPEESKPKKGTRQKKNVMFNVQKRLKKIRKLYTKRMQVKLINGRIDTKFFVLGNGEVIDPSIVKSTVNDTIFEKILIAEIDSWKFDNIEPKDDTTEVNYPFVFRK